MHAPFSELRQRCLSQLTKNLYLQGASKHWQSLTVMNDFEKRGVWWNAKRCWESGLATKNTHHLVLQDDVIVCKDFVTGVLDVIYAFPNEIISLFSIPRKKFDGSCRWGISEGVWGLGVVMPRNVLEKFLIWEKENIKPEFKHDDSRISLFCVKNKRTVKVPFPNLIDHQDVKSIVGNTWSKPRVSSDFMGERSPHNFDWNEKDPIMKSINSYTQYDKFLIK